MSFLPNILGHILDSIGDVDPEHRKEALKDEPKENIVPVVNLPEHIVGDEAEEGEEGDVHPPHPQQADGLHPGQFLSC